jgi:hypothetical protein
LPWAENSYLTQVTPSFQGTPYIQRLEQKKAQSPYFDLRNFLVATQALKLFVGSSDCSIEITSHLQSHFSAFMQLEVPASLPVSNLDENLSI